MLVNALPCPGPGGSLTVTKMCAKYDYENIVAMILSIVDLFIDI